MPLALRQGLRIQAHLADHLGARQQKHINQPQQQNTWALAAFPNLEGGAAAEVPTAFREHKRGRAPNLKKLPSIFNDCPMFSKKWMSARARGAARRHQLRGPRRQPSLAGWLVARPSAGCRAPLPDSLRRAPAPRGGQALGGKRL